MTDEPREHSGTAPASPDPQSARPAGKILRRILGAAVVVLLLGAGIVWWQAQQLLFRPVTFAQPRTVVVQRRATWSKVAQQLEAERIIPSAFALRVYARLHHQDSGLKVGEYELSGKMTPVQILELLNSGRVVSYWLTIPEGKWASEMGALLEPRWPEAAGEFAELVRQPDLFRDRVKFPLEGGSLEGYLFPNTYLVSKGANAPQIITGMLQTFEQQCWQAYQQNRPQDGRSFYEVLILASLIEAEARVPAERPIIAGVYINRMRKNMLLQCDATVLYAHRKRLSRVLYRDLEIDSRYNTYRYPGLPVGPICNPGAASFLAALKPREVTYLYYVAKGDGSHVFTNTLAEHAAAIRQIRGK